MSFRYEMNFGDANAGGSPTWDYFVRQDTGADLAPHPTIHESVYAHGSFYFDFDWTTVPAGVTTISYKATCGGVEQWDVISVSPTGTYVPPAPGTPAPGTFTLAVLRDRAKQRADMVNSTFVTDAEWLTFLNTAWSELYGILIEKFGDDYYAPEFYRFTTTGSAEQYPLPDGTTTYVNEAGSTALAWFKLIGLDLQTVGTPSGWLRLKRFPAAERNNFGVLTMRWPRYRLTRTGVWFRPMPQSGLTMRAIYAPRLIPLVNDADIIDGVSGWEELIVVDAARKGALKEESFDLADRLAQEKATLIARIEHEAGNRDQGDPPVVADVTSQYGPMGYNEPGYPGGYWY